jgi:hypothetical protein
VKWAGYVVLAVIVQFALAAFASEAALVGVLHGINAFILAAVAGIAGRRVATAGELTAPTDAPPVA